MIKRLIPLLGILLLGACARTPIIPVGSAGLPESAELDTVPFFPQQEYQCGPAALATMLTQRGVTTTPERLVERVYLPQRKGSLQVEMVAAARAHDLVVYRLEPRLEAVLTEVADGNPVLVLQNLAFDSWPAWHFAVVVGYNLASQQIVLRSGTTRRWTGSFRQFERTWSKSNRWAVLTVEPERIPPTATETAWLMAASDLEQTGHQRAALQAYRAAATHWSTGLSWFALGNARYAQGDKHAAERALRSSINQNAKFAAGWFNLSQVLAEKGCPVQASTAKRCAARLAPDDLRFKAPFTSASKTASSCESLPPCPVR